jgi:hypothetical protein
VCTRVAADLSPRGAQDFLAGGFGGVCLVTVGHPLDTIKVRLQTSNQYKVRAKCAHEGAGRRRRKLNARGGAPRQGIVDCVTRTYTREGFLGFYKVRVGRALRGEPPGPPAA